MRAFQDIRTEMRDTCISLTGPSAPGRAPIARVAQESGGEEDGFDGHIEPWMEEAFEGLTHAARTGDPFALVPCFMNGKPAAVIALVRRRGRNLHITPLFLACQPWMSFSSQRGESGDEEGGPARDDTEAPSLG